MKAGEARFALPIHSCDVHFMRDALFFARRFLLGQKIKSCVSIRRSPPDDRLAQAAAWLSTIVQWLNVRLIEDNANGR
jgi:hypothetical protein